VPARAVALAPGLAHAARPAHAPALLVLEPTDVLVTGGALVSFRGRMNDSFTPRTRDQGRGAPGRRTVRLARLGDG